MSNISPESDFIAHFINSHWPSLAGLYGKWRTLLAYLFSGGSAALVSLSILYFLTDILGWWYLASTVVAFCVAFMVSFLLQKYWTFRDTSKDDGHRQKMLYLFVALANLVLNTGLMYFFVDIVHIWGEHMIAQILTSAILAIESFFVYRAFIFRKVESVKMD